MGKGTGGKSMKRSARNRAKGTYVKQRARTEANRKRKAEKRS